MAHRKSVHNSPNTTRCSVETQTIRVLHIEDNQTIAELAREMLEAQGWEVQTCHEGNAALEHLTSQAHYDFLLCDYDLPGINGLELVRHTRRLVHRARIPIGLLSASAVEADAREAGVDVFLRKPQDIGAMAETIARLLEERHTIEI